MKISCPEISLRKSYQAEIFCLTVIFVSLIQYFLEKVLVRKNHCLVSFSGFDLCRFHMFACLTCCLLISKLLDNSLFSGRDGKKDHKNMWRELLYFGTENFHNFKTMMYVYKRISYSNLETGWVYFQGIRFLQKEIDGHCSSCINLFTQISQY